MSHRSQHATIADRQLHPSAHVSTYIPTEPTCPCTPYQPHRCNPFCRRWSRSWTIHSTATTAVCRFHATAAGARRRTGRAARAGVRRDADDAGHERDARDARDAGDAGESAVGANDGCSCSSWTGSRSRSRSRWAGYGYGRNARNARHAGNAGDAGISRHAPERQSQRQPQPQYRQPKSFID